jgi:hypothetical protein
VLAIVGRFTDDLPSPLVAFFFFFFCLALPCVVLEWVLSLIFHPPFDSVWKLLRTGGLPMARYAERVRCQRNTCLAVTVSRFSHPLEFGGSRCWQGKCTVFRADSSRVNELSGAIGDRRQSQALSMCLPTFGICLHPLRIDLIEQRARIPSPILFPLSKPGHLDQLFIRLLGPMWRSTWHWCRSTETRL